MREDSVYRLEQKQTINKVRRKQEGEMVREIEIARREGREKRSRRPSGAP